MHFQVCRTVYCWEPCWTLSPVIWRTRALDTLVHDPSSCSALGCRATRPSSPWAVDPGWATTTKIDSIWRRSPTKVSSSPPDSAPNSVPRASSPFPPIPWGMVVFRQTILLFCFNDFTFYLKIEYWMTTLVYTTSLV